MPLPSVRVADTLKVRNHLWDKAAFREHEVSEREAIGLMQPSQVMGGRSRAV